MQAERVIRKHVAIIHAYSLMSALQRKVVNILLSEAINQEDSRCFDNSIAVEHTVSFKHVADAANFNSNNTQYLKEAIDGLASLKIEWNLLKDKIPTNISFLNLRVLHGAPTFYQDGSFNYSFHKVMLGLVKNPAIYGTIDLELQSDFDSKYAHSLYENSTRFVNLHKGKIIQLEMLRKLLGVSGNKYTTLKEFTRNVLRPSLEEVNDRANFTVDLESMKSGRKVIGYNMSVKQKVKVRKTTPNDFKETKEIVHEVKSNFPTINDNMLTNLLNEYSDEYILEKIHYTKAHTKKDTHGFYPVPYFISAIKYDYKDPALTENSEGSVASTAAATADEWEIQLLDLNADLLHWKKNLTHAQKNSCEKMIENFQSIIKVTENKIKTHLERRATQER